MRIYVVNKGDTISSIARLAGIAPTRLAEDNGIGVKTRLFPGEEVLISEPTRQVYARRGDDLDCLARRYGAKKDDLIAYNPELGIENTLYEGQYLTLKVGSARYGMGIGNGYYYSGCKREKFLSALPYTSYITVAAAVYDGEKISMLFNDAEIVKEAKKHGKLPLLRIYHSNASRGADSEFGKSAAMLAKSHGYTGVTLAGARSPDKNALRDMTAEIKRAFIECGLKLFIEDQLECPSDLSDLADGVVLFYDKVGRASIPSFEEGEECLMRAYAEKEDSIRSFIDISPFAYSSGKYIPKDEIIEKLRRLSPDVARIAGGDVIVASIGKGNGERAYIYESLENHRKRLVAVSEYGYYGVSFDIARSSVNELLMFRLMFSSPITI